MNVFYTPDIQGNKHVLSETESKHCIKVLRLKNGDTVDLVDGEGKWYKTIITDAHHKHCVVTVNNIQNQPERDFRVHIAIAPTKNNDRFEWFLEKATEIGIDSVTPLLCAHSERKVIKRERLEKIIISAMKQSLKAYKPVLHELTTFEDFITQHQDEEKFIAHCNEYSAKNHLQTMVTNHKSITILIGPEGDFNEDEIKMALSNGYKPVSLGQSRLRTETAGIVACHIVNLKNN